MMKNVHTTVFSILFSGSIIAQPVVDGVLSDEHYISMATKLNTNSGFGGDINVTEILYFPDNVAGVLYLGVKSKLDVFSDDGIGVFLNVSGDNAPIGAAVGNALGFSGGGHYLDGDGSFEQVIKADFEVDYAFAVNPGAWNTDVYWDIARFTGGFSAEYAGHSPQDGTPAQNNSSATLFTNGSISYAFLNDGSAISGLEMAIPYSEIGATSDMHIAVLAFVSSATAYFSDVTVPGNITSGNLGFNPDFNLTAGGPFHTELFPLSINICDPPSGLEVNSITNGSAVLVWNAAENAIGYNIQIQNLNNGTYKRKKVTADVHSMNIGPGTISSGNEYAFTIKTICDENSSVWATPVYFSTATRSISKPVADVKIYPNPSKGKFFIELPETSDDILITVRTMNGDITIMEVVARTTEASVIPLYVDDATGLFILTIQIGEKIYNEMISVQ